MYKILAKTFFMGKKLHFMTTCHSTNETAGDLLLNGTDIEGTLIITDHQTNGKGQRGNSWESAPGKNLTFSLILKPSFLDIAHQFRLNIVISLAIKDYLSLHHGIKAKIKWPNDIYVEERKISGILIKNIIKQSLVNNTIIGIGFNVNQHFFSEPKAISLFQCTGKVLELQEVLGNLVLQIEKRYLQLKNSHFSSMSKAYIDALYWRDEIHIFRDNDNGEFEGRITAVDGIGRLVISSDFGTRTYMHQEVQFIS